MRKKKNYKSITFPKEKEKERKFTISFLTIDYCSRMCCDIMYVP